MKLVIKENQWAFDSEDNKWYAIIPFKCNEDDDVIIELIDSDEYIINHIEDFKSIDNGITKENECIITSDHKPKCDFSINIENAKLLEGEIIYHKDHETGKFIPEWVPSGYLGDIII